MGDHYFNLVQKNQQFGALPAVARCYKIAIENLKLIAQSATDANKQIYMQDLSNNLSFAEQISKKIKTDPMKFDIQHQFLAQYSEHEKSIIHAASISRDIQYELWSPKLGITNLYSAQQFFDPNGMLPLSLKQMKRFKKWYRAIDILDRTHFVNGYPQVAHEITGYEIMQKKIGDCSVLSSLAVTAHHEWKSGYRERLISNHIFP
mmetsp:Transcript_9346/g.14129  ORF Transcript_9346/g.14129 Transcript_9346/m.14129 type:complete len:205 (+) Transcript_9346:371-985(+)